MALSVKTLKQAQSRLRDDPAFRELGNTDCSVMLTDGGRHFRVEFHAFRVREISSVSASDARDCDFCVTLSDWQGYLNGRADGASPSLVELDLTDHIVSAQTPRDRLQFLRYHVSLQYFVDQLAPATAQAT